jgi:hypothetical protein
LNRQTGIKFLTILKGIPSRNSRHGKKTSRGISLGGLSRQRVSPGEAAVGFQALLWRDEFEPQARVELFKEIADHFRPIAEFPPEATDGMTDEQYIRNLVDILYRTRAGRQKQEAAA